MVWPHLLVIEFIAAMIWSLGLFVISALFNAPLQDHSTVDCTPNPSKAPWYLLPWDQLSFWAVTVGYEIARATPAIGDEFAFIFFGGFQLGPNALLRFYVLHVVGLPLTVGFLIAIHFWRIRKDGGITGPL